MLEIIRACFEHFYLSEEKVGLVRALEQVKAVSREKSDILDIVVHDLKNPLNAIIGLSEMIQNGAELGLHPADYQKFGAEIRNSATRMSGLVRNLLNIHALESGSITINTMPLNISVIADFIAADYRARATAKGLTLHSSPPISDMVMADEVFCHQIIENLLSNAIKYSPQGKNIWLETVLKGDCVSFSVKDEGPGISEEDQAKMFQKFTRLSALPTAGEDSTGLGLSIVKKFAEKMNARVRCESELGHGTTFFVEFPRLSV